MELRRTFTLGGKPVPPTIFREFGDGNLADSGAIWVTVDLRKAVNSNMYFGDPTRSGPWISEKAGDDTYAYRFVGATPKGLLVVVTRVGGAGSGIFFTLHILDAAPARAFDEDGKPYERLDLTAIREVSLGDRWSGDVSIAGDRITITPRRQGPDGDDEKGPLVVDAVRP